MLILAILIAVLVDAVAITALIALLRRSDTTWLRWAAITGTTLVVIATALVASLATVGVQTRIVMYALERQEPTATILAGDRAMRFKIRDAVRRGLSIPGDRAQNVKGTVSEVLRPYMAYRLSHAPDRFTIASARATRDMLARAKAQGTEMCGKVLSGDAEAARAFTDTSTAGWLPDMLKAEPLDTVPVAAPAETARFLQALTSARNWSIDDVQAASARRGPLACDLPIASIDAAVALPEEKAAALLRAMGFGGQAVTAR